VRDLNTSIGPRLHVRLELLKWETHTFASAGHSVQSVINGQMGDDYDMFLGVLWKRFGTPTGTADSGTQEEFERAYKRFTNDESSMRIMFYFKDAPVPPSEIDPEQLNLVHTFQAGLGPKGVLYKTFRNVEEFGNLVRLHLTQHCEEWGKKWQTGQCAQTSPPMEVAVLAAPGAVLSAKEEDSEEAGFLDLMEDGMDSFENLVGVAGRITSATESLGQKLESNAQQVRKLNQPGQSLQNLREFKRVTDAGADDLEAFAARLETEVPIFGETYRKGICAFAGAAALVRDFGATNAADVASALAAAKILSSTMSISRSTLNGFRDTVAGLPRVTTKFNRAKRRTLKVLDALNEEYGSAINVTDEFVRTFEAILGETGG